jgi:hypothetical protein
MRRFWTGIGIIALAVVSVHFVLSSPAASEDEKDVQRTYVGVAKCKMCHKTAKQGEQYPIWQKGPHAKSYETLANEESMKIAKEMGIDDPQKAPECLRCHVTAHGVDEKYLSNRFSMTDGVVCEACHGAGGDYSKSSVMKAIIKGEIEPASVGLVIPDEAVCVRCHNDESPTFKGFDFEKAYAAIQHPIPEERKAKYKTE